MKKTKIRGLLIPLIGIVVALCACLCLVACKSGKDKPPAPVSEASIRYDGTKFTWDGSQYATKYILLIGESERTTNNTQFGYKCGDDETVTVSITAVNNAGQSEAVTREFTRLATVTELEFDASGVMSWDPVEGASSYEVSVNNDVKSVDVTTFDEFKYGDRNAIKVRATGDETTFSFWSDTVNKEYLGVPTDIAYDGQDITWKGYASAKGYTVYVNGSEAGKSDKPNYRYDSQKKSFSVSVVANGDGEDSFDSKHSDEKTYTYLGAIEDMKVVDGTLSWKKVDGAKGYKLSINNVIKDITKTEYDLQENTPQTIRIQPYAANTGDKLYFAEWSEEKTYKVLNRPVLQWDSNFAMDGDAANSVYWNRIGDSDGYEVRLTDHTGTVSTAAVQGQNDPAFSYAYAQPGVYKVEVKSLAAKGGDTCDSRWSEALTIERLRAPNADTDPVTSDRNDLSKGFRVNFTPVSGANGYRLYRDNVQVGTDAQAGAEYMTVTDLEKDENRDAREIVYELQSIGSNRVISGSSHITLDSVLQAKGNSSPRTFRITILATPNEPQIEDYDVSWNPVSGASGYAVFTRGSNPFVANNSSYDLHNITDRGAYSMTICARGDGKSTLPSRPTAAIPLIKLATPTNIEIATGENEGTLKCSSVQGANGYVAYFNGNTTGVNVTIDQTNINDKIGTDGISVIMQAVGNYKDNNGNYYITSEASATKIFHRLKKIDTIRIVGKELVWSGPSNVTGAVLRHYELFNGDIRIATPQSERYDLSGLQAGDYTFSIRSIGDGNSSVNSEISATKSVYKPQTPEVEVDAENGKYFWSGDSRISKYTVSVGGVFNKEIVTKTNGRYEFTPEFNEFQQEYIITVTAVGNGTSEVDSDDCTIRQKLARAATPTDITVKYISKAADPTRYEDVNSTESDKRYFVHSEGYIRVTVNSTVANATGYTIGCATLSSGKLTDTKTYDFNVTDSSQDWGVYVIANGGKFFKENATDTEYKYLYDSLPCTTVPMKVLSAPTASSITKNSGYISWTSVGNGDNYDVTVIYDGKTYRAKTTKASCDYKDLKEVGGSGTLANANASLITSISIRTLGNGSTTITSAAATK